MDFSMKTKCKILCVCIAACIVSVLLSGCGTFLTKPLFPRRTGAEGVVLDQYNQPVPGAPLDVWWTTHSWASTYFGMFWGKNDVHFQADNLGCWSFYRRDADMMWIDVRDIPGYQRCEGSLIQDRVYYGQYKTNVVLRLHKIEPPSVGGKK